MSHPNLPQCWLSNPCTFYHITPSNLQVLPGWLTTILLATLLTFVTYRLAIRMRMLRRQDAEAVAKMALELEDPRELQAPLLENAAGPPPDHQLGISPHDSSTHSGSPPQEAAEEEDKDIDAMELHSVRSMSDLADVAIGASLRSAVAVHAATEPLRSGWSRVEVPLPKLLVLLTLLLLVIASNILKHSMHCPSLAYWAVAASPTPFIVAILLVVRAHLLRKAAKHAANPAAELDGYEDDVEWTPRTISVYPALCTFAGVAAGMFGVGGGIIKGPLMLEMGVPPEVAAATSATMILFTSASASMVFLSFGVLPPDYGLCLGLVGAVSTAVGQAMTAALNRRMATRTIIVIFMTVVMALSALVLAANGVFETMAAAQAHDLWQWGSVCGRADFKRD